MNFEQDCKMWDFFLKMPQHLMTCIMEMNRNELDASPNYSSLVYTTDFATRSIQQAERIFSEQELAELIREF